jgi:hypothetical protein
MAPIAPKFTTNPLVVRIEKQGANWQEEVMDVTEMKARLALQDPPFASRDAKYKDKFNNRKKPGRDPRPRYARGGNHVPAILTDNEKVRFECPAPFVVILIAETDVQKDGRENPIANANGTLPFTAVSQPDGTEFSFTCTVTTDNSAFSQGFFKMVFVVIDDDGPHPVDPDFFCDR